MQQFPTATTRVLRKACRAAHRAMDKPPDRMTIKDAAWQVMQGAYEAACGGVGLANARQIMYRARPLILEMTGQEKKFNDKYLHANASAGFHRPRQRRVQRRMDGAPHSDS